MFLFSACALFTGPVGGHVRKIAEVLGSVSRVIVGEERINLHSCNHNLSDGNRTEVQKNELQRHFHLIPSISF